LLAGLGHPGRAPPSAICPSRQRLTLPACSRQTETLTVLRLGVPPTLARTLRSTNCIESMVSVWPRTRRQRQALAGRADGAGWCAAGMAEAGKQFRRVNGHLHLPTLRAALERESAESVGTMGHDDLVSAA